MRRTITMKDERFYYRGKLVSYVRAAIRSYFKLGSSGLCKYVITIVESKTGKYRLVHNRMGDFDVWHNWQDADRFVGAVCFTHFKKLFFHASSKKRYDITVEKVKIKK